MAVAFNIVEPGPAHESIVSPKRPAVAAATRVARAGITLSGLGLAASLFVLVRLFETWRIGAHAPSNAVSILGLRVSYPVANADALIILLLAFVAFVVGAMIFCGMARELLVSHRVNRKLVSTGPVRMGDAFVIEADERARSAPAC